MKPLLLTLEDWDGIAARLAQQVNGELGQITVRRFPDGESYVRADCEVQGRNVILFESLARPDAKVLPLIFCAKLLRDLGASSVNLVAPYLPYMRQDKRFQPGEAVTSAYFAQLLSGHVDGLVTADPHLHRRSSLGEIYTIPCRVMHAAPLVSAWIKAHVDRALLVGPDEESAQWVAAVAAGAGAPYTVLTKKRRGDRDVEVSIPDVGRWQEMTPVLVDDIISTARTMIETVGHLKRAGLAPPVCIGVHGIFAGQAFEDLKAAGAAKIVTTNAVPHASNAIDITALMAKGLEALGDNRPA